MSIKHMTAVFGDTSISPTRKLIMLAIADNANDGGVAFPSLSTMGEKTSLGRRALIDNINWLIENGYLLRVYRSRKKGGRSSNKYLIYPRENYSLLDEEDMLFFEKCMTQSAGDALPPQSAGDALGGQTQSAGDALESEPSLTSLNHHSKKTIQKREPQPKAVTQSYHDATIIADYLYAKITEWKPKLKSKSSDWVKDIDKAIRLDSRTKEELIGAIDWMYSLHDGFWQSVVLSGRKLREQFDTMEARRIKTNPQPAERKFV